MESISYEKVNFLIICSIRFFDADPQRGLSLYGSNNY